MKAHISNLNIKPARQYNNIALASPKSKAALGRVADGTRRGGIAVDTYIVTAT